MYLCDIFKLEGNQGALWLEAVPDFDAAKTRIRALGKSSPGDYLVYTQRTDKKAIFRVGPSHTEPLEIRAYRQGF